MSQIINNVGIVGLGGIGSWFTFFIYDLIEHGQIEKHVKFYLIDDDEVEDKNIKYQYYRDSEIFEKKAHALVAHFGCKQFEPKIKRITSSNELYSFDAIISCVDNYTFRKLLFEHSQAYPEKYWIDMRAEGRTIFIMEQNKQHSLEFLKNTISKNLNENTSCQLEYELEQGWIQQGNKIIAGIGSQYFLNRLREEKSARSIWTTTI